MRNIIARLRPQLIAEWRHILKHAWSMHLTYAQIASAVIAACYQLWPYLEGLLPIPQWVFLAVLFVLALATPFARVLDQGDNK